MSDEGTTSYEWEFNGDGDDGFVGGDDDADMCMDIDSFLSILNEDRVDQVHFFFFTLNYFSVT